MQCKITAFLMCRSPKCNSKFHESIICTVSVRSQIHVVDRRRDKSLCNIIVETLPCRKSFVVFKIQGVPNQRSNFNFILRLIEIRTFQLFMINGHGNFINSIKCQIRLIFWLTSQSFWKALIFTYISQHYKNISKLEMFVRR